MTHREQLPDPVRTRLHDGTVLPAHPLALTSERRLDEERQRALTRYYLDAGAGGLAVGVHTTQFAIREHGLYEPVLRLAAETAEEWSELTPALVAGVTGRTEQSVQEATIARGLGYHAALVNVAAYAGASDSDVLAHCSAVAAVMPVIGFSLLPAVGGFHLSYDFWRQFATIDNVIAIKMAPFNRYRTLDIIRAVVDAGRESDIALYTGNDDHIVLDLIAPFVMSRGGREVTVHVQGGLLGHWSVWTCRAVELFGRIKDVQQAAEIPAELLGLDSVVTQCNGAVYDALHDFKGAVPGCLEVLRRQGLLEGTWCLDPTENLGPGQAEEIGRVYRDFPDQNDDDFVRANLERWLSGDAAQIPLAIPA